MNKHVAKKLILFYKDLIKKETVIKLNTETKMKYNEGNPKLNRYLYTTSLNKIEKYNKMLNTLNEIINKGNFNKYQLPKEDLDSNIEISLRYFNINDF